MTVHPVYRFSGIGRPVDPACPTNRAILLLLALALVVGAVLAVRASSGGLGAGLAGANAGLSTFLAWALTRELSPDDNAAAFLAAALAWFAWLLAGEQSLLSPVVVLMSLRLVNRSTGRAALASDTLLLLPLFVFAAWTESWTLAVVGAAALALDGVLPTAPGQAMRRSHRLLALFLAGFAALLGASANDGVGMPDAPVGIALIIVAVLALAAALFYPAPRSRGDVDGLPLVHIRVRAGLLLGVYAAVLVTADAGLETTRLSVLWSSLAATVAGLPFVVVRRPLGD